MLRQCALQLIIVSESASAHWTLWRCWILKTGVYAVYTVKVSIIPDHNLWHRANELLVNSAIAGGVDDGSRMSLTQTASSTVPFFTSLHEGEGVFLSTSLGGAFGKPMLIPSDVDSDTEHSGDDQASDNSNLLLPPACKLRMFATEL